MFELKLERSPFSCTRGVPRFRGFRAFVVSARL